MITEKKRESLQFKWNFNRFVTFFIKTGKGADPKSPVGTAFSFSRPKRQASAIAIISRVLQFASKRFVNSFLNL